MPVASSGRRWRESRSTVIGGQSASRHEAPKHRRPQAPLHQLRVADLGDEPCLEPDPR